MEVKDVRVPEQLQRAMAAEAEAAREARAKVIAAEGEHKASRALRHAAEVIIGGSSAESSGHMAHTWDSARIRSCVAWLGKHVLHGLYYLLLHGTPVLRPFFKLNLICFVTNQNYGVSPLNSPREQQILE